MPLSSANGKRSFGFKLTKNGAAYEFYFATSQIVEYWTDALRNVCVMTNFHSEYKALKLLGEGGFARVRLQKTFNLFTIGLP